MSLTYSAKRAGLASLGKRVSRLIPWLEEYLIDGLPNLLRLVTIWITRFSTLDRSIDGEASFTTEIDSISLELIRCQPGGFCTPSTITKGLLSPVVFLPRTST